MDNSYTLSLPSLQSPSQHSMFDLCVYLSEIEGLSIEAIKPQCPGTFRFYSFGRNPDAKDESASALDKAMSIIDTLSAAGYPRAKIKQVSRGVFEVDIGKGVFSLINFSSIRLQSSEWDILREVIGFNAKRNKSGITTVDPRSLELSTSRVGSGKIEEIRERFSMEREIHVEFSEVAKLIDRMDALNEYARALDVSDLLLA